MTHSHIVPEEHFHEVKITEKAAIHTAVVRVLQYCQHVIDKSTIC
jgi:hypothetical protein